MLFSSINFLGIYLKKECICIYKVSLIKTYLDRVKILGGIEIWIKTDFFAKLAERDSNSLREFIQSIFYVFLHVLIQPKFYMLIAEMISNLEYQRFQQGLLIIQKNSKILNHCNNNILEAIQSPKL